jgi:hypothetical protein
MIPWPYAMPTPFPLGSLIRQEAGADALMITMERQSVFIVKFQTFKFTFLSLSHNHRPRLPTSLDFPLILTLLVLLIAVKLQHPLHRVL